MSKGGIVVLVVAAIVFAGLGFVFGQVVHAAVNNPGPLVSEDWVEVYVGQKMAEMQTKIDELEEQLLQYQTPVSGNLSTSTIPEPGGNTAQPQNPTQPQTPAATTVKIKSSSVNVRSDADVNASIVGSVAAETTLTYLDQKNDSEGRAWYKIKMENGTEGWVAGWLCYEPK